ncbi:MAG: hypothetical protein HY303_03290 [Candidatus Wallbacteria bacterium]|nr:hypothetical protein [Candidatus Wallbacteria bacterium]
MGIKEAVPASRFRQTGWVALLWLAAALFFWPVLIGGQSFCFRDTLSIYYPQASMTVEALRNGELPLWEPRIGLGYPFQSDPHSMVFYPLTPLLLLLPFPRAYNLFTVVHFPLAGTCLFVLLRRWRLSAPAATLGALVLMFAGYTVTTSCLTTLLRGMTWTVAALLAFDCFLDKGGWAPLALTALALACQGSCTDPQYMLFAWTLLALAPWLRPAPANPRRALIAAAAAAGLGLAVLAYQYLPLAQLIACSDRKAGLTSGEISMFAVDPADCWNLLLPSLVSNPEMPEYFSNFKAPVPPLATDMYWGIPMLALALAALGWRSSGSPNEGEPLLARASRVWLAVALVTLILSMGHHTPFFPALLKILPILAVFRYPTKYLLLSSIAVAVAAALGYEGIRRDRTACKRLFASALGLAGAVLGCCLLVAMAGRPGLVRGAWLANLGMAGAVVVAMLGLVALQRQQRLSPAGLTAILGCLAVLDLVLSTCHSYPLVPDAFLTDPPRASRFLKNAAPGQPPPRFVTHLPPHFERTRERTMMAHMLLRRETLAGLRGCVMGLDPLLGFMSVRIAGQAAYHGLVEETGDATLQDRLAAAAGTRYVLALNAPGTSSTIAREVGRLGPIVVQELDPAHVLPRVFIAGRASPAPPGSLAVSATGLLAMPEEASFEAADSSGVLAPKSVHRCRLARYDRCRLEVEVELEGSGLLVVSDIFYPGWKARVDGVPRPLVPVAGLFRGVQVRQGDRQVEMSYEPWTFRVGLAASALVLLAMGLASVGPLRRRLDGLLA